MDEVQLRQLLSSAEDYQLELKAARTTFTRGKLNDYAAAISNHAGGYLILGVTNDRQIVGSSAFIQNWNLLANQITGALGIRVQVFVVNTTAGRVLVFKIQPHVPGIPVQAVGGTGVYRYPIRDGESLVEMSPQSLQEIFAEREEDWSAEFADGISLEDLDPGALDLFRARWAQYSQQPDRVQLPFATMLSDVGLAMDGRITNAAVLILGRPASVTRVAPDAEIIFEWRNVRSDIAYGDRKNWRAGFLLVEEDIWRVINARNSTYRYQEGFVQRDIPAYDEETIREAVVNAFAHRDYRIRGRSIIIKVSPEEFYIENPGRLMSGVTLDNIFDRSVWRNRLLAESLEKVRLMERSSQGIDKIFRNTITAGKGSPAITLPPDPSVALHVPAVLTDQQFINFLEQVARRQQLTFSVQEIIELEKIRKGQRDIDVAFKDRFVSMGIIQRVGSGRGVRYILSGQYYRYAGASGEHTRLTGLRREVKKNMVLEHLSNHGRVTNSDLRQAMPDMSMEAITSLLKSMRRQGLIIHVGPQRYGHWELPPST